MPTNLYGPGDNYHPLNSHVFPALIKKISDAVESNSKKITCWGTGNPLREFLYVDDLAEACLFALENWNPITTKDINGKPLTHLNVGTGLDISIHDLAKIISKKSNFSGKIYGIHQNRMELQRSY